MITNEDNFNSNTFWIQILVTDLNFLQVGLLYPQVKNYSTTLCREEKAVNQI